MEEKRPIAMTPDTATYINEQKDLRAHVSGNLSDTYIKSLLKRQGVPITVETLDLKRCVIIMKRTKKMLKKKRKPVG